ncbi:hypothetical protein VR010_07125 [Actinomycetaceae bacterium L2_0104]
MSTGPSSTPPVPQWNPQGETGKPYPPNNYAQAPYPASAYTQFQAPPKRRRKWPWVAGGAIIGLAAAVTAVLIWWPSGAPDRSETAGATGNRFLNYGASGLAIAADGTLWSWDSAENGTDTVFHELELPEQGKVVDLQLGYALDDRGHVWAWDYYAVGNDIELSDINLREFSFPQEGVEISKLASVPGITNASRAGLALDTDGTLWTWGDHSKAIPGFGDGQDTPGPTSATPTKVEFPESVTITDFSNAIMLSSALDSNGAVWTWGLPRAGLPERPTKASVPSGVEVLELSPGIILSTDGDLYALASEGTSYERVTFTDAADILPGTNFLGDSEGNHWFYTTDSATGKHTRQQIAIPEGDIDKCTLGVHLTCVNEEGLVYHFPDSSIVHGELGAALQIKTSDGSHLTDVTNFGGNFLTGVGDGGTLYSADLASPEPVLKPLVPANGETPAF